MKFKSIVATVAILGGFLALGAGGLPSDCGRLIGDEEAAGVAGGCAGVGESYCTGEIFCPLTSVFVNGTGIGDYDPGSIPKYYCKTTTPEGSYCLTCAATYVSCAGSYAASSQ